jgi:hypothetical protein
MLCGIHFRIVVKFCSMTVFSFIYLCCILLLHFIVVWCFCILLNCISLKWWKSHISPYSLSSSRPPSPIHCATTDLISHAMSCMIVVWIACCWLLVDQKDLLPPKSKPVEGWIMEGFHWSFSWNIFHWNTWKVKLLLNYHCREYESTRSSFPGVTAMEQEENSDDHYGQNFLFPTLSNELKALTT